MKLTYLLGFVAILSSSFATACPELVLQFMDEGQGGYFWHSLHDVRWSENTAELAERSLLTTLPTEHSPSFFSAGRTEASNKAYLYELSSLFPLCLYIPSRAGFRNRQPYPFTDIQTDSVLAETPAQAPAHTPKSFRLIRRGPRTYRIIKRQENLTLAGVRVSWIEHTFDIAFPSTQEEFNDMRDALHPSNHLVELYLKMHSLPPLPSGPVSEF